MKKPGPRSGENARSGPSGPTIPKEQRKRQEIRPTVGPETLERLAMLQASGWKTISNVVEAGTALVALLEGLRPGQALILGRTKSGAPSAFTTETPAGSVPADDWETAAREAVPVPSGAPSAPTPTPTPPPASVAKKRAKPLKIVR